MPSVKLSPLFNDAQLDNNGLPLSGGQVYWYIAGTTTPVTVYTESSGSIVNTNPVELNTRGEPVQPIWLPTGQAYKAVLTDAVGGLIRTIDNIYGINDTSAPVISEWVLYSATATYVSTTSFSVAGDQRSTFTNDRRIKATVSGTDVYGTINGTPTYALGVTTVPVTLDGGVLDSSLTTVYYGFLDPTHPSFDTTGVNTNTKAGIQSQTWTAFTTTGTASAFVLTPTPTVTTPGSNTRFNVKFHISSSGTPTLTIGSITASLKQYNGFGKKIKAGVAINQIADVIYDGTDYVIIDPANAVSQIQPLFAAISGSDLVITLDPTVIDFVTTPVSTTVANVITLPVPTSLSLTIPSGATLGTVSGVSNGLLVLAINNAGTVELAVCSEAYYSQLFEFNTILSTTILNTASDSFLTVYSATVRINVAFRLVGAIASTQATAGTWSTAPSVIYGSNPFDKMRSATTSLAFGVFPYVMNFPASARTFTVSFRGINTATSGIPVLQLLSGSTVISGTYNGTVMHINTSSAVSSSPMPTGYIPLIDGGYGSANNYSGSITITRGHYDSSISTYDYYFTGLVSYSNSGAMSHIAGYINTIASQITSVQMLSSTGTNVSGGVNTITYTYQ